MAKKYSKRPSSNGKTKTPSRRDGRHADLIRGRDKNSFAKIKVKRK